MTNRDTYIGALNAALAMNGELLEALQALVAVVGELPETDGVTQGHDLHVAYSRACRVIKKAEQVA